MEEPILIGQARSKFYFNTITIYKDRMEAKGIFLPRKIIYLKDILSWTEINHIQNPGNIRWTEIIVYTAKTSYKIMSLHWNNYNDMKELLVKDKFRDVEKEKKIANSFWT